MSYVLGIDISTTAAKALILSADGDVKASASTGHDVSMPHPLWSEQNPEDWWDGCCRSINEALTASAIDAKEIVGIGLTGQMHGLVLLDSEHQVLRPAILWNDQRTSAECDEIREQIGSERLLEVTGNGAMNGFTAPKLLWVRNHEPDVFRQIEHVLLPKDFVRFKLTGEFATDKAGAGGTLLFDLKRRTWSAELIEHLGLEPTWFPPSFEGPEVTGSVTREAATRTTLNLGTPVVAGAGDQAAQAIGVGAIDPETWAITIGTSGVVFVPTAHPHVDSSARVQAFPHGIPDEWHMMGVMLSAASCLKWYHDSVVVESGYDELLAEAASIKPGAEGLFFQPYLTGERTPHNDPLLRASFVGLTSRHGRAHFTRAILEGVAFGLRDNLELFREMGLDAPSRIRISGGGAQSDLWAQIVADVLGARLERIDSEEAAAVGAAMLAGVASAIWPSLPAALDSCVTASKKFTGRTDAHVRYEEYYLRHTNLYPVLRGTYR